MNVEHSVYADLAKNKHTMHNKRTYTEPTLCTEHNKKDYINEKCIFCTCYFAKDLLSGMICGRKMGSPQSHPSHASSLTDRQEGGAMCRNIGIHTCILSGELLE